MVQISWTAPSTFVAGAALTAAQLNTNVRDNLNYLKSSATAVVATTETTASLTYAALATAGPAVTVTTDVQAIVAAYANVGNNTGADQAWMGFDISGATTVAASDPFAVMHTSSVANNLYAASGVWLVTGLTAGSNTFTAKYRTNAGTAQFATRKIVVIPA